MIFNSGKIYAKVWKIDKHEKYLDLQISTSEKDDEGNYKNSSWFPRCISKAFNTLKNLKEGDRICITKSKFTNERFEGKDGTKRSYFKFVILEATIEGGDGAEEPAQERTQAPAAPQQTAATGDDECPW